MQKWSDGKASEAQDLMKEVTGRVGFNDEMEEANASGMAASDALLLGRVTYEQMAAYWPQRRQA